MKKWMILVLIILMFSLGLLGCEKQTIEITRFEEEPLYLSSTLVSTEFVSYEPFLDLFSYYYNRSVCVESIYLPRQGEFVTSSGDAFSASVENITFGHKGPPNFSTHVSFTLRIYSPEGELLLEEAIRSRVENEPVSEAMAPYWDAVKILPEDLFQKTK